LNFQKTHHIELIIFPISSQGPFSLLWRHYQTCRKSTSKILNLKTTID